MRSRCDESFFAASFAAASSMVMSPSSSSFLKAEAGFWRGVVVVLVRAVDTFRNGVLPADGRLVALRGTFFLWDRVPLLVRWGP